MRIFHKMNLCLFCHLYRLHQNDAFARRIQLLYSGLFSNFGLFIPTKTVKCHFKGYFKGHFKRLQIPQSTPCPLFRHRTLLFYAASAKVVTESVVNQGLSACVLLTEDETAEVKRLIKIRARMPPMLPYLGENGYNKPYSKRACGLYSGEK